MILWISKIFEIIHVADVTDIYIYNCNCYENVMISVGNKITGNASVHFNRTLFSTFIIARNGNFQLENGENEDTVFLLPVHGPLKLVAGTPQGASDHVRSP